MQRVDCSLQKHFPNEVINCADGSKLASSPEIMPSHSFMLDLVCSSRWRRILYEAICDNSTVASRCISSVNTYFIDTRYKHSQSSSLTKHHHPRKFVPRATFIPWLMSCKAILDAIVLLRSTERKLSLNIMRNSFGKKCTKMCALLSAGSSFRQTSKLQSLLLCVSDLIAQCSLWVHAHWTRRARRSDSRRELPCNDNSSMHTARAKQCATQCHVHNWDLAPFACIICSRWFLAVNHKNWKKMLVKWNLRRLQNVRRQKKQRRKFLMMFCLLFQCFFHWWYRIGIVAEEVIVGSSHKCTLGTPWQRRILCPGARVKKFSRLLLWLFLYDNQ